MKTLDRFIEEAITKHGQKYIYSNSLYNGANYKLEIICKMHGLFYQTPSIHLRGSGCPKCYLTKISTQEFIEKAEIVHGNTYDYSLVEYTGSKIKILIICRHHNIFKQSPSKHLCRQGCPKCGGHAKLSKEEFIRKANIVHTSKYQYNDLEYSTVNRKGIITCVTHGNFEQKLFDHLGGHGCLKCGHYSKGEESIKRYLVKHNILFKEEFIFDDLKYKSHLRFDFYIPNKNILIEFDGRQHFKEHNSIYRDFENVQIRDSLKNRYAKINNINLIRIPYWKFDEIPLILNKELNIKNIGG